MLKAGIFKREPALVSCHTGDFERPAIQVCNNPPVSVTSEITYQDSGNNSTFFCIPIPGNRYIIMSRRVYALKFPGHQPKGRCDNQFMSAAGDCLLEFPVALRERIGLFCRTW